MTARWHWWKGVLLSLSRAFPPFFPLFLGKGVKPAPERTVFILGAEEWPRLIAYKCSKDSKEYRLKESNLNTWASVVQLQCVCGARGAWSCKQEPTRGRQPRVCCSQSKVSQWEAVLRQHVDRVCCSLRQVRLVLGP
jgi:hypothetical protein